MNLKAIYLKHSFFWIYNLVFLLLIFGDVYVFGIKHLNQLVFYFASFVMVYFLMNKFTLKWMLPELKFNQKLMVKFLIVIGLGIVASHLLSLGGSPAIESLDLMKISEVNMKRKSIGTNSHFIWKYLSSMNIKAILPFLLLILLIKKNKMYWVVFFIGCFYCFSLMQKSHILSFLIPVLLYTLFKKNWLYALKYGITIGVVIIGLVFVSSPSLRGGVNDLRKTELKSQKSNDSKIVSIAKSLTKRIFIMPGEMVGNWFEIIPQKKPFLKGKGYNAFCKITKQKYHDYNLELYPVIFPDYANQGIKGSVNSAHFMRGYSNFGNLGLFLSAIMLALMLSVLNIVFQSSNQTMKLCINLFPIFLLSSGSLSTILFSGGWGLLILLFWIFKNDLTTNHE